MNPFYRMLVHRISDYFGLGHNVDQLKQSVIVFKTEKTKMLVLNFRVLGRFSSCRLNGSIDQQFQIESYNAFLLLHVYVNLILDLSHVMDYEIQSLIDDMVIT
jgi:hypothetical protein